ncbi:MAG: hypothetical protein ACJAYB_000021 [Psychromonas sp.]|jgi:hypothetical protein
MKYEIQTSANRDTVWIHCDDGSTVGRFSKYGIDLHNSISDQMAGAPECRFCTHGAVNEKDWAMFIKKAFEFWGVVVDASSFDYSETED